MADPRPASKADMKPSTTSSSLLSRAAVIVTPILAIFLAYLWPPTSFTSLSNRLHLNLPTFSQSTLSADPNHHPSNEALRAQYSLSCPEHLYGTHIFSASPFILYLTNFITPAERSYLLSTAASNFERSATVFQLGDEPISIISDYRTSFSALIEDDPVATCIRHRTASLQGFVPTSRVETLQAVKYAIGQQYHGHYDWEGTQSNPRLTSIFAYLACSDNEESSNNNNNNNNNNNISPNQDPSSLSSQHQESFPSSPKPSSSLCTGGSTHFPSFSGTFPSSWCDIGIIDCSDAALNMGGIAFKSVEGNAVFWSNLLPNGSFDGDTWHRGLPVEKGVKVGLNIWTRRDEFTVPVKGKRGGGGGELLLRFEGGV